MCSAFLVLTERASTLTSLPYLIKHVIKKFALVVASEKDVLTMSAVFLKSFHSFLPSPTFCIASTFFSHILQPLACGALSCEQSWQNSGAIGHPSRHPLRVILQSEQHYSEVQYVYMDGCLSRERGCNHCEIVHVDFTLVKFHSLSYSRNSCSLVKIFQMFSLICANRKA